MLTPQHGQEDSMKRRRRNPGQIIRKLGEAAGLLAEGYCQPGSVTQRGTLNGTRQLGVEPPGTAGSRHFHRGRPRICPVKGAMKGRYMDAWRRANRRSVDRR